MTNDAIYKQRMLRLTGARLAGLTLSLLGLVLLATHRFGPPQPVAGGVLIAAGLLWSLLVPRRMLRRWRAEDGR